MSTLQEQLAEIEKKQDENKAELEKFDKVYGYIRYTKNITTLSLFLILVLLFRFFYAQKDGLDKFTAWFVSFFIALFPCIFFIFSIIESFERHIEKFAYKKLKLNKKKTSGLNRIFSKSCHKG